MDSGFWKSWGKVLPKCLEMGTSHLPLPRTDSLVRRLATPHQQMTSGVLQEGLGVFLLTSPSVESDILLLEV